MPIPKKPTNFSLTGVLIGILLVLFIAFAILTRAGWISMGGLHD